MSSVGNMTDSSQLYTEAHWGDLRHQLAEDGYLLLRGVLSSQACRKVARCNMSFKSVQGILHGNNLPKWLQVYSFLTKELNHSAPLSIDRTGRLPEGAGNLGLLSRYGAVESAA